MLTLLLGEDWTLNRKSIFEMIASDVAAQKVGRILLIPELISHDTERMLCKIAGDTASRFAEVLTFTRLVNRVSESVGYGVPECLDSGGRLVAMASATRQLHSKLKSYAAVETQAEFLVDLLEAVDEFKRCCISAEDLNEASLKSQGSLAQKLEELSLIFEAYNSLCVRGKRDPRDQMTWLLEQLEDSDFAKNHIFYIDGFPDFTRQHTAIINHLITESPNVVISLNCDTIDSSNPAFEKAGKTASELLRLAQASNTAVEIMHIPTAGNVKKIFLPYLFQGRLSENEALGAMLQTYHCDSVLQECHAAAENILTLVQSGCRYRDIGIVCTDMAAYGNVLQMILSRYCIPIYQSGTEDILDKTVITTVLSAIDAVVSGFEQSDVLRYLKSSLSPLDLSMCDRIENYAIIWNITGSRWKTSWTKHPGGLGMGWTDAVNAYLEELNSARSTALEPLFRLEKGMNDATCLSQLIQALYVFLEDIQLAQRMHVLATQMERSGDLRNAQILGQLWEILLSALEQLSDMLGDTHWDVQTFTKLLKLLLSQYDVGTIPAVLDAVTVGQVSTMRCQQVKHMIILGANEGNFPAYSGSVGILTDYERTALRQLGVPLTGGAMEGLQAEFAEIYGVFCGTSETISISYSSGQPSFVYRRLCEMSGKDTKKTSLEISPVDSMEVGAFILRKGTYAQAVDLGVQDCYQKLQRINNHSLGSVSAQAVQNIYGAKLNLSASQTDKLADCRFAYFLKYGLRLKERKQMSIDPAEFGTYVHAVLEQTGRKIMEMGGFHHVSLKTTLEIANFYSREYINERFHELDSPRASYLFQRNIQELEMVVTELWDELQGSAFEPVDFELAFGMDDTLDSIQINGTSMIAQLRGFVDRVDAWNHDGRIYYRVVDYKTGKKDFDYCDIYNGLGLQMLLYLFALEDMNNCKLGKHPIAAGVQYFPARAPVVTSDGKLDEQDSVLAREKLWKRKGLLLADETVLEAMEQSENPKRLSYSKKKDGSISGDLANRQQLQLLKGYIFALLGKMVDEISSGCIEPNPYTRGSRHNACTFCPYGSICHQETVSGRRNYAAMSQEKFWEEIEKEMSSHGRKVNK